MSKRLIETKEKFKEFILKNGIPCIDSEIIDYMAELELTLKEKEWINVNDRLPNTDNPVLVHPHPCRMGHYLCHTTKKWIDPNEHEEIIVTHWMPYPDAPRSVALNED